jgi:RHH-type proline utilization regulon transcriptional repressor/proline dehydrogenase/delta 1-pyrroline-5-carboxylate dehydrogenase
MNSHLSWREQIRSATRMSEKDSMLNLVEYLENSPIDHTQISKTAHMLVDQLRIKQKEGKQGLVQELMQEYALSSQEGVALMCLAEALLRVPDTETRNALIRDKIANNDWASHINQSPSFMVNAASWGLHITGKLVSTGSAKGFAQSLATLIRKGGEPVIRQGMNYAMRLMGEQFVSGETIEKALAHTRAKEDAGFRFSFDMLGEAAMTSNDAARYLHAYETAIHAIGQAARGDTVYERAGISIKLSALHPRYSRSQKHRVMSELYTSLVGLVRLAKQYNIGVNIDAEESERLDISLDLFEKLCSEPEFAGFNGLGFVVQAYQKRAFYVLDFLIGLAKKTNHRLMIRLVKGAYWDSEIKRAQQEGQADYPVFTRKVNTDLSYLACAKKLLEAPEQIFAQFATHNAQTVASILTMAGDRYDEHRYEFQCLYGMGEPMYEQMLPDQTMFEKRPCRVYAPVGTYETLLPYLVRRLLENGANSSFVNRISDESVPIESLIEHPLDVVKQYLAAGQTASHPNIALPISLFRSAAVSRANSSGLDLADELVLSQFDQDVVRFATQTVPSNRFHLKPLVAAHVSSLANESEIWTDVCNPANRQQVLGRYLEATPAQIESALVVGAKNGVWQQYSAQKRAEILEACAHALASSTDLFQLIIHEAGKTVSNAVGEVREAVDFLNYYAAQCRLGVDLLTQAQPLGLSLVISPWNFPLAIPVGQVSAALAAGNSVILKPAEQTSLTALWAVELMHRAGVPLEALQCLPGRGETVGARLTQSTAFKAVLFTGSNETAKRIESSLHRAHEGRVSDYPAFVAETGGINTMLVDSSALGEQVVNDVLQSAFDSAGQRCSALRVLCVQQDQANHIMTLLKDAMQELVMGRPEQLSTDVGPVIDLEARDRILNYIEACRNKGFSVYQVPVPDVCHVGYFVPPTVIEVNSIRDIEREVFGPVLHVVRFDREQLSNVLDDIAALRFGLTMGLHTRVDERISDVQQHSAVGNFYVNRNMVGAVVGVQPFGGEGLSGTGPKAGGVLMLPRLCSGLGLDWFSRMGMSQEAAQKTQQQSLRSLSYVAEVAQQNQQAKARVELGFSKLNTQLLIEKNALNRVIDHLYAPVLLESITGEHNAWWATGRGHVAIAADRAQSLLSVGLLAIVMNHQVTFISNRSTLDELKSLLAQVSDDLIKMISYVDLSQVSNLKTKFPATVVVIDRCDVQLPKHDEVFRLIAVDESRLKEALYLDELGMLLMHERAISINTAAAGGNTSLMTMQ